MRKLLNTLFVLTAESYLTLDGENIVVNIDKKETARFPLHNFEAILCFSYAGASPALMGACAERGIDMAFFSPRGKFLVRVSGENKGNVLLRQEQYRSSDDQEKAVIWPKDSFWEKSIIQDGFWNALQEIILNGCR